MKKTRPDVVVAVCSLLAVSACALDGRGLQTESDGAVDTMGITGSGGTVGTGGFSGGGGAVGSGGTTGSGGAMSTGGAVGSGGAVSSGGATGSGGVTASGGKPGTGGAPGAGGAMAGTGGAVGSGGVVGSGGSPGTGGGNIGTGGAGTGGMVVGTGGRVGTGGAGTGGAAACGPTSCPTGCCMGNKCVTSARDEKSCGDAGAACAPCAACFRCGATSGTCEVDPASPWTVTCGTATVAQTKGVGMSWDGPTIGPGMSASTAPDPFCAYQLDGVTQKQTSVVMDSYVPTWNQSVTPSNPKITANYLMSQAGHWSIFVADDDAGVGGFQTTYESICSIAPHPTATDFSRGMLTYTNLASCLSLTIQLTCAQ